MVYKTYKYYNGIKKKTGIDEATYDFDTLFQDYLMYVRVLTIFAVGHFNFETPKDTRMDLRALDVTFTFKDWSVQIQSTPEEELLLTFEKERKYRIGLTVFDYDDDETRRFKQIHDVDELITLTHMDEDYLETDKVYIGIDEIDSFRRIQQILLKGMIYADRKRDVCPFCGGRLIEHKNQHMHQCFDCMIQIKEGHCPETNLPYIYTDCKTSSRQSFYGKKLDTDDDWIYRKQLESAMYFRNITKINRDAEIVCPHCNKVH
jgi:hypothetical protein